MTQDIAVDIKEYVDDKNRDIRDIIDTRFAEIVHRVEYRAEVAQTALKEAKTELSARLAGMNEFRDTIKDLIASFATRSELETIKEQIKNHIGRPEHVVLSDRITLLEKNIAKCVTHEQFGAIQTKINAALVGLVLVLCGVVIDVILRLVV